MNRGVTGTAFEPLCDLKYFLNLRVGLYFLPELRYLFKCLTDAHVPASDRRRYQLGDPFDFGIRHFESPADVLDGSLRGERSERDDLAYRVTAIQSGHVVDDVASAADTKVDIDVRHRDAAWVEKALEE